MQHRIGIDLGGTKIEIAVLGPGRHARRFATASTRRTAIRPRWRRIAGLVRDAEAQLGVTATVGIGIPGVISPVTGLVKNANSIALNGHPFDRDISACSAARSGWRTTPTASRCPKRRTAPGRPRRGVRRHPRHRLRRRHRGGRQGHARPQPRHRRVGPQPVALAAARGAARAALLVRPLGLPGDLDRRPRRWRATATARMRTTRQPSRPAPPPATQRRRRRSIAMPTGWRAVWRRSSTCSIPT